MSPRAALAALIGSVAVGFAPTSGSSQSTSMSGGPPVPRAAPVQLSPPAACTKTSNDWRNAQMAPALAEYRKATDSNRTELMNKYVAVMNGSAAGAQKAAADCAAQFSVESIPLAQLADLITLYNSARDTSGMRRATERLLSVKDLPPRAHGQALLVAMNQASTKDPSFFGIIPAAEKYVAQIDQLPDSLDDIKLLAHRSMLGRYEYLDVAEGLRTHATAVIVLARKTHQSSDMISGYSSLARSFADQLDPDSALKILDAGEKEIGSAATERFNDFRNRYALIGTPAARVSATWWINPDAKEVIAPTPGRVTLIEFTAHWCGPCKNSYPGLRGLAERFKGKPFDGFMVTSLYGYLGAQPNLSPEQEVAADRDYFGKEHALPFPVAINPPAKPVTGQYLQPKPDTDYRVGGIPQIMIIDKKGIIRQIVTGWDQGNTERFSKLIEKLITEK